MIIGNSGVGKFSLLTRFIDDTFSDRFLSTIGLDFKVKTLDIDSKSVNYKYGIQQGKKNLEILYLHIIVSPKELC